MKKKYKPSFFSLTWLEFQWHLGFNIAWYTLHLSSNFDVVWHQPGSIMPMPRQEGPALTCFRGPSCGFPPAVPTTQAGALPTQSLFLPFGYFMEFLPTDSAPGPSQASYLQPILPRADQVQGCGQHLELCLLQRRMNAEVEGGGGQGCCPGSLCPDVLPTVLNLNQLLYSRNTERILWNTLWTWFMVALSNRTFYDDEDVL